MRTKKLFLILALLCAIVQGAWAQNYNVWDGSSTECPIYGSYQSGSTGETYDEWCEIRNAAQLAYVREHWGEFYNKKLYLKADLDMTAVSWTPLGHGSDNAFEGTLYGGQAIRIYISNTDDNYQGLFAKIGTSGKVQNLHLTGEINVGDARMVGGIAGVNHGMIENCWVSADITSSHYSGYDADLGGIAGWNESGATIQFCCMTGNVQNTGGNSGVGGIAGSNDGTIKQCTFYGSVSVNHSQDSKYVGDQDGTVNDLRDTYDNNHYSDASGSGYGMYAYAYKYPYSVTVNTIGHGSIQTEAGGESGVSGTHTGETFTLNVTSGTALNVTVTDADGNNVPLQGHANDNSSFWFVMPSKNVTATVTFDYTDWPTQGAGTVDDPYIISSAADWYDFAHSVRIGRSYSGNYVKLTADIDVNTMAGVVSGNQQEKPFSGIFDGGGHTITATISDIVDNQGTALFKYINGATIKNLTVAGSVNGGLHAAAIVGFSKGTGNSIENCKATATVNGASHIGGILGHGLDSHIDITKCIFSGKLNGGSVEKGAIYGWGDTDGVATVNNCLYAMQDGQDETNLDVAQTHGGTVTVTDTYKSTSAGSYGWIVDTDEPWIIGLYAPIAGIDGNTYYLRIGSKSDNGNYSTYADMTVKSRIIVKGPITLTLGEGTTLNAKKGIELSSDEFARLTINGPGALNIDDCEKFVAGIGAVKVGTLIINGGSITVKGGYWAAGIGCSYYYEDSGSSGGDIIINGGVVTAYGGDGAAGIGGSAYYCNSAGNIEICGGQVKAFGNGVLGIGPGRSDPSGTLKLGWTNPDDFVYIKSGNSDTKIASITFVEGKQFYLEHTATFATATNLYDYKLIPYTGTLPSLAGEGTENNPYLISSTDDWLLFGELINSDTDYSGKFVKLAENISVTTWVGTREDHPFSGTFDGGGHTLTVNISHPQGGTGVNEQGVAPFHFIENATIKNLTVDGDITSDTQHTSGLVGFAKGTNLIEGCTVKAKLHVGQNYVGGIVGHGLTSTTTIKGCVFAGTIEGVILYTGATKIYNVGGIWGWSDSGTPTLENCLEAGTYTRVYSMHPMGLQNGSGTITNCYYMNPQVGTPTNACTVSGAKRAYAFTTAPANLGELVKDYGTIKVYPHGILYNGTYYMAFVTISLADNSDNSTTISNADGYLADVTLSGRTLYKDGAWNTICLPFDVTLAGSALNGATARPLTAASISGTTLNLTFGDAVTTLEAGTPYIIKWDGDGTSNIENPVFEGVTIEATKHDYDTNIESVTTDERVRFVGTYKSTAFDTEDQSILFMGGENTLYYPITGASIGAQRAYFKIGEDGAMLAKRLTAFNINFGDDETTGIISIENGKLKIENDADAWYTIDGRKLSGKPTQRGIYINNGKKTIIK